MPSNNNNNNNNRPEAKLMIWKASGWTHSPSRAVGDCQPDMVSPAHHLPSFRDRCWRIGEHHARIPQQSGAALFALSIKN